MIAFREVEDADPALAHSPMLRAMEKTSNYIAEHGGIALTHSRAFKRSFVHWAAAQFDWPGHTEADLFAANKVLNEPDFVPLMVLHDLMIALKIGRHYKGEFRLTKAGQVLVGHPGRIFGTVVPFFLFRINHASLSRFYDAPILGNWDVFLNVLNVLAEHGATGGEIRRSLFGEPRDDQRFDETLMSLYLQVLRPLCWTGLLREDRADRRIRTEDRMFMKTPLWRAALRLDTDEKMQPVTHH